MITLGTATPGGGFPVYGAAFADTLNAADPTLLIQTRNTRGSLENVPLLEAGTLDIALVQGEVVLEALNGIGAFSKTGPANLKIIAAMYSTPGMFVVRADSPYRNIRDLTGQPVAFGASGSGLVILARYVLDGIGLDQDRDFRAIYLERAGDGPAMVADGRAAALWGGRIGLAGLHRGRRSARRRPIYRTGCRRHQAHFEQAHFFARAEHSRNELSRTGSGHRLGGFMELRACASVACRGCCVQTRTRPAS